MSSTLLALLFLYTALTTLASAWAWQAYGNMENRRNYWRNKAQSNRQSWNAEKRRRKHLQERFADMLVNGHPAQQIEETG